MLVLCSFVVGLFAVHAACSENLNSADAVVKVVDAHGHDSVAHDHDTRAASHHCCPSHCPVALPMDIRLPASTFTLSPLETLPKHLNPFSPLHRLTRPPKA
jgi:hypothetical protein